MKRQVIALSYILMLFTMAVLHVNAQTDTLLYVNSSFETPDDQSNWTSTPPDLTISWDYYHGGHNWPISPKSGDLNARFFRSDYGYSYYRNLESIPIDLSTAEKPQLSFWHAQDKNFNQDELYLLFKAGDGAPWDTIRYYPNEVENWTEEIINVHEEGTKYLCEDFQMSFLGFANGGNGVCVDSVVLRETATIDKFVKSYSYQDVEHTIVASKTKQLPMIRLQIEIMGNNGASNLDHVSFRLNSGSESYFKAGGFKLFLTQSTIFKSFEDGANTQIGSAVSVSSGVVSFTSLNQELELGNNYLWLTADLADDIPHNSTISFGVDASSFQVNDTLLPAANKYNIFTTSVKEAVFYDNFDAVTGWTLENDFEIDAPQGKVILNSKDPGYAYSGTNVLGTDLTDDGGYQYNFGAPYHATSPLLDLKYYDRVLVYMRKWNDFNPLDEAAISFSSDGGSTWKEVWNSKINNPTASADWEEIVLAEVADEMLSRKKNVRIRFSMLQSNTPSVRAGFNIDNFTVTANYLDSDIGITQVMTPYDDCLGFGSDTIRIVVKNYAAEATQTNIPVFFGKWGIDSTLVYETIPGPIGVNDSIIYTFAAQANFPYGDIYHKFIVGVSMPGDEDPSNDTLTKPLIIPDSYTPPVTINFEYKGGVWIPSEGSTWLCKEPDGSIPVIPDSPNAWILSPYGDYLNSDTSYIVSNCFDLSFVKRHIVDLDYWLTSEAGVDGAALQYSTNDGASWNLIDNTSYGPSWNWYSTNVSALGHNGWSGFSSGWVNAKELLPEALQTEVKVKFRVLWAADEANNGRGFAFDNFKVYPAPPDVGVSTIEAPYDACQLENTNELSLWVKNFGFNDLAADDTLILGYRFENEAAVIDTFLFGSTIIPGDSVQFILPTVFNIEEAGTYLIKAFTLIEDDPWFYGDNNDTLGYTFEIFPNPLTGLVDTIQSRQPDTLLLQANVEPGYTYLWDFEGSTSTNSFYDVDEPGVYYLTVTESGHGCQTFDSTYIELLFNDVGIDSIIWPVSSCELSSSETVQIQIRNMGTDSLLIGEKFYLTYEFEGGAPVYDSITLTEAFYSGDTRWFSFTSRTEDLSAIGDYDIKAYCYYGGDTIPENDTIRRTISVFGYPSLDLGNDMVINGLSYLLNVDPSFDTYLWNDGVTEGTRIIDTSGYYYLDVLDINGCPASDSIDIWFRIRDVSPALLLSPTSSCERSGTDLVEMRIINSGSDTISSLETITISYRMESGTRHSAVINTELLPGESYDHTFSTPEDLTDLGSYEFELTAVTNNDLRPENDTLHPIVLTDVAPIIDLGVDEDEVYTVTEMVLDAGYNANYVYLWQDGSRDQTYTVTDITQVRVLVTDTTTGCYGGDTVLVYLDILDYLVTNIALNAQSCSGIYNDVDVSILNNGNLPRQGAEITLDFYKNSGLIFTEYFENIGTWPAGATRTLTTNTAIDLSETGDVVLEIQIESSGDLRPNNDDYLKNIEVIPSPVVNFGGSQVQVPSFPYTLDAGSGQASYLWSDGSTQSTFTATEAGTYTVTVTGTNGCQTVRSVYVDTDLAVSSLAEENMDVTIYPNPAVDYIHIEVTFNEPDTYILEVFNSQNILFTNRKIEGLEYEEDLFIGDLPAGLYFIRIRNERMYHTSKMIIY